MKIYVYPTDLDWFTYLSQRPNTDEVNFWRPGGIQPFRQLATGEILLFKLKGAVNKIAGGGVFLRFSLQSIAAAWDAFGDKNGLPDFSRFRETLAKHKEDDPNRSIGCVMLVDPVFLPREKWIDPPDDYQKNLTQGKAFDAATGSGRRLFDWAQNVLFRIGPRVVAETPAESEYAIRPGAMWSGPVLARRRLGQGGFKFVVSELYERRCAISGERKLRKNGDKYPVRRSVGRAEAPGHGDGARDPG